MTQGHWAIRFYLPFEEGQNVAPPLGNFEGAGSRFLDDIVVFSGIYGIPDYMLWYIHKDMLHYDFSMYSLELKIFSEGDPQHEFWTERYRIVDVGDDLKSDRKLVYAIHEDYAKLDTLLLEFEVATLEYNEKRIVEDLLKDVLEKNGIFPVVFCEHYEQELQSIKFEYPKFTIDKSWTVRDFIQYVADENKFEWTVKHGMLFIGPELYTYKDLKASKEFLNRQVDNTSKNYWNMKITWALSPCDVLWYYELIDQEKLTDMRCIWTKHEFGANGDGTKACFIRVGTSIDKIGYIQSLEGIKETTNAYHFLFRVPKHHQVRLAKVRKDEGDSTFVDEITLEKSVDEYAKKTPRNVMMNTKDPIFTLPNVGRTTPYLDYGAGLLFPRIKDVTKAPNQILLEVEDRVEEAVLGPFVMGDGTVDFKDNIPAKKPDDFRLSLPNGWTLYIDDEGNTIIQTDGMDPTAIPSADTSKTYIKLIKDGIIDINTNDKNITINQGGIQVSLIGHTHPMSQHTHTSAKLPLIVLPIISPPSNPPSNNSTVGESDKHSKNFKVESA